MVVVTSQAAVPITTSSTSTTSSSPTTTPTPTVSVLTVSGGGFQTITVTPPVAQATNAQSATSSNSNTSNASSGGLSTGQAVGLTVGVLALAVIVAAIIFCCVRRRRKNKENGATPGGTAPYDDGRLQVTQPGHRASHVDPRCDPFSPLYENANRSTETVGTLDDAHDYSRRMINKGPLRTMNP